MVGRLITLCKSKNDSESFSSSENSILTIDIVDENKMSTCSSEEHNDSPMVNNFDARSMVTISSWHSKKHTKIQVHEPINSKNCTCTIY